MGTSFVIRRVEATFGFAAHSVFSSMSLNPAFGHVQVPSDYVENPSLACWCTAQQKLHRQKLDYEEQQMGHLDENGGKRKLQSLMTDGQEGKLLALGFEFSSTKIWMRGNFEAVGSDFGLPCRQEDIYVLLLQTTKKSHNSYHSFWCRHSNHMYG